jgi:O-succinylbenzoic acid--CoA ligase
MVPTMYKNINFRHKELQNLKAIIIGGDSIEDKLIKLSKENDIPLYVSYGSTETCSGIAGFWSKNFNRQKKYHAHNGVNIYVDKSRIIIKSRSIMKKYFNQKKTNSLFKTLDFGKIFSDGSFNITRDSNMAISGGENISIKYVKKHIESHPEINSCNIEIKKDDKWGEILIAEIKQTNNRLNKETLKDELKNMMPAYMIPKEITLIN